MVASIGKIASPVQGVGYFERDGYYARDDGTQRETGAWAVTRKRNRHDRRAQFPMFGIDTEFRVAVAVACQWLGTLLVGSVGR